MTTKHKLIFLLASLSLSAMSCGGSLSKPVSGFDVSALPAQMLSITPSALERAEAQAAESAEQTTAEEQATTTPLNKIN